VGNITTKSKPLTYESSCPRHITLSISWASTVPFYFASSPVKHNVFPRTICTFTVKKNDIFIQLKKVFLVGGGQREIDDDIIITQIC
jgi:hypothetical protein